MDETIFQQMINDFFALREVNDELCRRLEKNAMPADLGDEKFLKGVYRYLEKVFLPISSKDGLNSLYENIRRFAHDYPCEFRAERCVPVWVKGETRGADLSKMMWSINKAVGYKAENVGVFLKASFPDVFRKTSVQTISSNLLRDDKSTMIVRLHFGLDTPRRFFEKVYDKEIVL